jgi:hypothetical protein
LHMVKVLAVQLARIVFTIDITKTQGMPRPQDGNSRPYETFSLKNVPNCFAKNCRKRDRENGRNTFDITTRKSL